jgi:hypothetical protein
VVEEHTEESLGHEEVYHLACLEARAGQLDEARAHLARAVELRPDLAEQAREDTDLKEVV